MRRGDIYYPKLPFRSCYASKHRFNNVLIRTRILCHNKYYTFKIPSLRKFDCRKAYMIFCFLKIVTTPLFFAESCTLSMSAQPIVTFFAKFK